MEENAVIIMRGIERLLALGAGTAIMFAGLAALRWGLSGKASLVIEGKGIKFQFLNASPGLLVCIFGAFIVANAQCQQATVTMGARAGVVAEETDSAATPGSHTTTIVYGDSLPAHRRTLVLLQSCAQLAPSLASEDTSASAALVRKAAELYQSVLQ